ncbi:hypothetical protein VI817_009733 [Penicillium citrinum]|nr:hypothetical protein VI817_009733 [Penicillium citrinum]
MYVYPPPPLPPFFSSPSSSRVLLGNHFNFRGSISDLSQIHPSASDVCAADLSVKVVPSEVRGLARLKYIHLENIQTLPALFGPLCIDGRSSGCCLLGHYKRREVFFSDGWTKGIPDLREFE